MTDRHWRILTNAHAPCSRSSSREPSVGPLPIHVEGTPTSEFEGSGELVTGGGTSLDDVDIHRCEAGGYLVLRAVAELEAVVDQFLHAVHQSELRVPGTQRLAVPASSALRSSHQELQKSEPMTMDRKLSGATIAEQIRIQFLSAVPDITRGLRVDKEHREIIGRIQQGIHRDRIIIQDSALAVQAKDIQRILRNTNANVIHFSGHGGSSGYLIVEDRDGSSKLISPSIFRDTIELINRRGRIVCIVLNACHSVTLADELVRAPAVVPCAIGTTGPVDDGAAVCFSDGFYSALADGMSFREAFKFGKNQVQLNARPSQAELFKLTWAAQIDLDAPMFRFTRRT